MRIPFLVNMMTKLSAGGEFLSESERSNHVQYLLASQLPDGGFAGRDGGSDLYYTAFAVRSLAALGELQGEPANRVASYLQSHMQSSAALVDLVSLIFAGKLLEVSAGVEVFSGLPNDWTHRFAKLLETFRRPDGGYAKTAEGMASSTYHSFLVVLTFELLELPMVKPESLANFVLSQQRETGGFVEIRAAKRGGTNPTAAAVAILQVLDQEESSPHYVETIRAEVVRFLSEMQTSDGGLRANTRIPIDDLLSTFTGLLTLDMLNACSEVDLSAMKKFVEQLAQPEGSFCGAVWDEGTDVEYTFYGIGSKLLLHRLLH